MDNISVILEEHLKYYGGKSLKKGGPNVFSGMILRMTINHLIDQVFVKKREHQREELISKLDTFLRLSCLPKQPNIKNLKDVPVIPDLFYDFDLDRFNKDYLDDYRQLAGKIVDFEQFETTKTNYFQRYAYIITPDFKLRLFTDSLSPKRLLEGKSKGDGFPVHPMLAYKKGKQDLKVRVAGEVSFFLSQDKQKLEGIFIDNVSGHFLPENWRPEDLIEVTKKVFNEKTKLSFIIAFSMHQGFNIYSSGWD